MLGVGSNQELLIQFSILGSYTGTQNVYSKLVCIICYVLSFKLFSLFVLNTVLSRLASAISVFGNFEVT